MVAVSKQIGHGLAPFWYLFSFFSALTDAVKLEVGKTLANKPIDELKLIKLLLFMIGSLFYFYKWIFI
jgi:hypothetical protein